MSRPPLNEAEIRQRLQTGLSMIKSKVERDEGLRILEEVPMTLMRLHETGAGQKICRVFRSSRYFERAQALHSKWIALAERELTERWSEVKHLWLTKTQIRDLDRAQAKYDRSHKRSRVSTSIPITPGRQRDDSMTDMNSSFSRDFDPFPTNKENDRWFMDAVTISSGVPRTPRARDTDDSFDEGIIPSEGSTYSELQFGMPERRGRGRPRKNPAAPGSAGRGSAGRRGRRGRPPLNR